MTGATEELQEIARARAQRAGLERQAELVQTRRDEARTRQEEAARALAAEERDVAKLENLSLTRAWAAVRGRREDDLERERAEAQAAQYRLAETTHLAEAEERQLAALRQRIHALGDLDARHAAALAAREAEVAADPGSTVLAEALTANSVAVGEVTAELTELRQAQAAAGHALTCLSEAARTLNDARGWSTYDTFFGGGIIADLAKHGRMDEAAEHIRRADRALGELAAELADVGIEALGALRIDGLQRAFDIWFDNIFTDYAVRERVVAAGQRVDEMGRAVQTTAGELTQRIAAAQARRDALETERIALLTGG